MSRRNPGEGSISKRASGTWQVSLQVNGKRKTIYGKSERENIPAHILRQIAEEVRNV